MLHDLWKATLSINSCHLSEDCDNYSENYVDTVLIIQEDHNFAQMTKYVDFNWKVPVPQVTKVTGWSWKLNNITSYSRSYWRGLLLISG